MMSCPSLRHRYFRRRCNKVRCRLGFAWLIGSTTLGCNPDQQPIRPDWRPQEHDVCAHLIAEISDHGDLLDVSGYDGMTPSYWELRKIDDTTLQIKHSNSVAWNIELNEFLDTIDSAHPAAHLVEDPDPAKTFVWVKTELSIFLFRFDQKQGLIARRQFDDISSGNWTHRLAWLENQPYMFTLAKSFTEIRAPIELDKLRPDLSVEKNWSTGFCLAEYENECEKDDDADNDNDNDSKKTNLKFFATPSYTAPVANVAQLSIAVEVLSSGHENEERIQKKPRLDFHSNIYLLRYYKESDGLKYQAVHAFSRDSGTFSINNENLVEISHSPWATYVLAPNNEDSQQADLAKVIGESQFPQYVANPFGSSAHLVQRKDGPLIASLQQGRFEFGRIKHNPVLSSIQLDGAIQYTYKSVGTGLVLLEGNHGSSKLMSLNCLPQR